MRSSEKFLFSAILGVTLVGCATDNATGPNEDLRPSLVVTIDPATGLGFVGKGDVQLAFGWNNPQLQNNASGVTFSYVEIGTYTVVCAGHSNASQNPKTFTNKEIGINASVVHEERRNGGNGQITGFNLTGLGDVVSSGEGCPAAWTIELDRTPNDDAGTVVGLFAHHGGTSVNLTPPLDP